MAVNYTDAQDATRDGFVRPNVQPDEGTWSVVEFALGRERFARDTAHVLSLGPYGETVCRPYIAACLHVCAHETLHDALQTCARDGALRERVEALLLHGGAEAVDAAVQSGGILL